MNSFSMKLNFLHADAVLAGHAAAASDALVENFAAGRQHAVHLLRIAFVEQQNRMDVAVAGVEHVDDPDVVLFADLGDACERCAAAWCAARRRPACNSWGSSGPTAPNACLRHFQSFNRSSASSAWRTSRAPHLLA